MFVLGANQLDLFSRPTPMQFRVIVRSPHFRWIAFSSMLALVTSVAAVAPSACAERLTREIDGVRFEFSADQADIVEALAPRVSELNQDAIAQSSAVWVMPKVYGPLSESDFRENRDAWLAAAAKALGLDAPTPLQIECYDHYLHLIDEFKSQTEAWVANARTNRQIKSVTLWNKADLRQRLLAGEKIPGFSTTKDEDLVHFDWTLRGAPSWSAEDLAQHQNQLDALRLNYTFATSNGATGTVFSGRTTPRSSAAPQERLIAPEPAAGPVLFPFIIKPEHAGLAAGEVVTAIFDESVRAMRDSFGATTAPALDQKSIARLMLLNLIEVGLRERVIANTEQHWFSEGTTRYLAWQVAQARVGAEEARRAFGVDEALLEVADLRTAVDLGGVDDGKKASKPPAESGRLAEAQRAFATQAVRLMVEHHGENFLAKLFAEIRKTPVTKTDRRTVAQAYKKLTGATIEALLHDAVSVESVAKLKPSWLPPGVRSMPEVGPAPTTVVPRDLPHEHSDLAPDSRITWGRLDNGLRYAILPHPVPTRRASVFLLVEAGRYFEHYDERSFAHYVEHMAFNGLRDFPKQTLISRLSGLGLQFGSHVNATTSLFTTTYNFNDLPTDEPEALQTGVQILRNIADGILFDPEEVKQESAVILQEYRVRAGSSLMTNWSEELDHLPPAGRALTYDVLNSVFNATRLEWWNMGEPIRQITEAKPNKLRAFYDRWYRPERMIVVVAGDISAAEAEPLLKKHFASLAGRGPAEMPPAIPDPRPIAGREPALNVIEWPQETQVNVTVANNVPRSGPDSRERRRQQIALTAALELIEARYNANIPARLDAWTAHDIPGWDIPLLRLSTGPEHLQVAALSIEHEFRRAWMEGFGTRELERYVAKKRDLAAYSAIEADRLNAAQYAQGIAHATASGVVFMGADEERVLKEQILGELTPELCRTALRNAWPWHRLRVIATGPIKQKKADKMHLAQTMLEARLAALEPAKDIEEAAPFPFTDFGPAGMVTSRRHDVALDTWFVTFANGVRLNIKHTDTERDWVKTVLNFGHGALGTPKGKPGLLYSLFSLLRDGLEGHPEYAGAGKPPGYEFDVFYGFTPDYFYLLNETKTTNLPQVLRYFAATLTHPGNRGNIEEEIRSYIETDVAQHQRVARAVAEGTLLERSSNDHITMHHATQPEGFSPTCDEMRTWLKPQLAQSPIEITIVGDCDIEATIATVAKSVGAFPPRETIDTLAEQRAITPRTGFREHVDFQGFNTVSAVSFMWPMEDKPGAEDNARLAVLARILEFRIWGKLREEMGEVYAPSITPLSDHVTRPWRLMLGCTVETKPRAAHRCATAIRQIAATLAGGGVTDDEMHRALQPLKREAEINLGSNAWWLDRLRESQSKPEGFTDDVTIGTAYAQVTRAEVEALARTLLREENTAEVIAAPK